MCQQHQLVRIIPLVFGLALLLGGGVEQPGSLGQQTPGKTLADLVPGEGLDVQLWAHEPQLYCPTAFDIDEKGRVWVAEGVNYRRAAGPKTADPPYYLKPLRKTGDRIVVLEDTKGTGVCDSARVFYEGLDIKSPQGFAVIGDKVWVSQSPTIFTIEIKPDGTAGKKETVLTGFNGLHSDHSVHSLTMGPDGKLYGTFGDTGCDTRFPDGSRLVTDGKPWRPGCAFRMNYDLSGIEVIGHNFRNGYECASDSFGTTFMSDNDEDDGNQYCRFVYVMEGGNFGWQPMPPVGLDWNLEQPGHVPLLMRTGAGAPAGLCVYEGTLLPEKYRGAPLLAECGAGWVGAFRLTPDGAGFRVAGAAVDGDGRQTIETLRQIRKPDMVLSSRDGWFRPSDVAVAPDGSVFVADFYNHIAGGRNLDAPWRGRIYRLIPKGHDGKYRVPPCNVSTADGLITALGSPNLATRARASLRIRELGPKALEVLTPHAQSPNRVLRARVLFQLATLGSEGQKVVSRALEDNDPVFRIVAIRALGRNGADMVAVARPLLRDPSPQVRRELLLALRDTDPAAACECLVALANQYDGLDRFYLEVVGIAFRGREAALFPHLVATWQKDEWNRRVAGLMWVLRPREMLATFAAIAADRQRELAARRIAVDMLGGLTEIKAGEALAALLGPDTPKELVHPALRYLNLKAKWVWKSLGRQPELQAALERLMKEPELRTEALQLSRSLGTRPLAQWMVSQPFPSVKGAGFDKAYPPEQADKPELLPDWTRARADADGTVDLAAQRTPRIDVVAYAATLLNVKEATALRLWLGSAAGIKVWLNGKLVHARQGQRELAARQDVIAVSLVAGVNRLLVKTEQGAAGWAYVLELEDPLAKVVEVTDASIPKVSAPASERLDPNKLPPDRELLALKGDASRGRQVFLRSKANCASCHKIKGEGGEAGVGPTLDGIGNKMGRDAILSEILRPSQSIAQQYYQWTIATKKGVAVTGVIVEETPERVVLKDAQGKATTIAKADIDERTRSDVSIMPEQLVGELTRQELADLLQYLVDLK
jgi:putative membrane-bound dehydrogenase-like protein